MFFVAVSNKNNSRILDILILILCLMKIKSRFLSSIFNFLRAFSALSRLLYLPIDLISLCHLLAQFSLSAFANVRLN